MTTALAIAAGSPLAALAPELASAQGYAAASRAQNTRRAYAHDLAAFHAWCTEKGLASLPADGATVALYLGVLADRELAVATIERALVAISQGHRLAGHDSPRVHRAVRETFAGIRRKKGTAQRGKAPMLPEHLSVAAAAGRDDLIGLRDRALLVVGEAGAFRRSELVSLDVADLEFRTEGLVVTLRRSKTDQEGEGHVKGLPYGGNPMTCPVRTTRAWLDAAGISSDAVFRAVNRHGQVADERLSDRSVALIVKAAAERAGLDPAVYAGHSLRAGLATAAARAGKAERTIMRQTGHTSERMVRRYIREESLFNDNAAGGIGL